MENKILWIDDEDYTIGELADILKKEGMNVTVAETKEKWEEEIKRIDGYYKAVIFDIMLPKASIGIELFERINKHWTNTPIIILSGVPEESNKIQTIKQQAMTYIEKPVLLREFRERVLKVLKSMGA